MSKETGGPAFPSTLTDDSLHVEGMTLRDYFAAKAMQSVYADYCAIARIDGFDENWQLGVAIDAYRMANVMLKVRGEG